MPDLEVEERFGVYARLAIKVERQWHLNMAVEHDTKDILSPKRHWIGSPRTNWKQPIKGDVLSKATWMEQGSGRTDPKVPKMQWTEDKTGAMSTCVGWVKGAFALAREDSELSEHVRTKVMCVNAQRFWSRIVTSHVNWGVLGTLVQENNFPISASQ